MCGVFGYVGKPIHVGATILEALQTLDYRGYDSWGLAVSTGEALLVDKDVGRLTGHAATYPRSTIGIGHTRWATHGGVTVANAHPHLDCTGRIAVVHNGIIENHAALRTALTDRGHQFASETDTEVVAHLVEEGLAAGLAPRDAVSQVFSLLAGYNAIVVLDNATQQFVATKNVSPLVVGLGPTAATIASDAIALAGHADRLIYLDDGHLAVVGHGGVAIFDRESLQPLTPAAVPAPQRERATGHGAFADFMSKETAEQPETLRRLVGEGRGEVEMLAAAIAASQRVLFVGCGTAGHAAMAAPYLFRAGCPAQVAAVPASEFRYLAGALDAETLVVALSQSGETVDVLDAVAAARRSGAQLAAIVNAPHSTLDRLVATSVHLRAGPERCVLATKSYTAKLGVLLLAACAVAGHWSAGAEAVHHAASAIEGVLAQRSRHHVAQIGQGLAAAEHLFVIGRGMHYPSALEAALKIKEVSYLHAEGFASGELKHGVIALIAPGTPCLVLAPDDETRTDVLSGAAELRSRGGHIIGVGSQDDPVFDDFIAIPDAGRANFVAEAIAGQLLGYSAALARGNDPDRPRNLAKSVTVK